MVLHGRQIDGTDTELRCNASGQLINQPEAHNVYIQGTRNDTGAYKQLICSAEGSLLTQNADQTKFGAIIVLKDNSAIAPGYLPFVSGEVRRGLRITLLIKHEGGLPDWNATIDQSIDNTNWITTNEDLNFNMNSSHMLEFIGWCNYTFKIYFHILHFRFEFFSAKCM